MRARKRFGQNFLIDNYVIENIIRALQLKAQDRIIEIGPGRGALTKPLFDAVQHLEVIELDRDLATALHTSFGKSLTIYTEDALSFDFKKLVQDESSLKKLKIVGNLPYNISTPLIFHLLSFADSIESMHFMLQKEVVDRLIAGPNHRDYGRLSIMVQYYCKTEWLFQVPPSAFYPAPKVESAFVRLIPHPSLPFPARNLLLLQDIVRIAFNQRRKTLSNALKVYLSSDDFATLQLNPKSRPENLSVEDYVKISNFINAGLNRPKTV